MPMRCNGPGAPPYPPTAIIHIRQHHRLNQQEFSSSHLAEEAVPEQGETEARRAPMTSSGPAGSLEHPRPSALQQALRLLRQSTLSPYQVNSGSFPWMEAAKPPWDPIQIAEHHFTSPHHQGFSGALPTSLQPPE